MFNISRIWRYPLHPSFRLIDADLMFPDAEYRAFVKMKREQRSIDRLSTSSTPESQSAKSQSVASANIAVAVAPTPASVLSPVIQPDAQPTVPRPLSVGKAIERSAMAIIGQQLRLDNRRIVKALYWDGIRGHRARPKYREVDGAHVIDNDLALIYEVKAISNDLMYQTHGHEQLQSVASLLRKRYYCVHTRLVYVAPEGALVRALLPTVDIDDIETEDGVIVLSPEQIEAGAGSRHIELPAGWTDLDTRYAGRRIN